MKKRFFLLLALTAALLLALGMSTALATEASPDDGHEHWAWCENPTVCAVCSTHYSGSDVRHEWNYYQNDGDFDFHTKSCTRCGQKIDRSAHSYTYTSWAADENGHWKVCEQCGLENKGWYDYHVEYCDKPGVCYICGAAYTSYNSKQHHFGDYQSNEKIHWRTCSVCGEQAYYGEHYADCDNPNVCSTCGAAYSGNNLFHEWNDNYQYNETEHWQICTKCSAEILRGSHWSYCDNPDVCAVCGATYSGNDIRHEWDYSNYQYNETEHWVICTKCSIESYRGKHASSCINPGVCDTCGAAYSGSEVSHVNGGYHSDETYHWLICSLCGKETLREEHIGYCDNPTVCIDCKRVHSGENVLHYWNYQYDETAHWQVCSKCGEEKVQSRDEHWAWCNNPGVCAACGAAYSGQYIRHYWKYEYDETEHWQVCTRCGEEQGRDEHYVLCGEEKGVCIECGVSYSGDHIHHYVAKNSPYYSNETNHWRLCSGGCGEILFPEAHTFNADGKCSICGYQAVPGAVTEAPTTAPTDAPTTAPTDTPTEVPTEAPTTAPTDTPTEVPTEAPTTAPTDVPTAAPTDTPTEVPTEVPTETPTEAPTTAPTDVPTTEPTDAPTEAPTEVPTEVPTEAPTAVPTEKPTEAPTDVPTTAPTDAPTTAPTEAPTTAPTAEPTKAPHTHVFRTFVSRGDGTHRSDCEGCATFTVQPCDLQTRTVNGIACQVCSICGYVAVPAVAGMALPETAMADVTAVTATGEAASILVFDVTASLPEDSGFVLCLRVVPQDDAALPGSVRITIPCTVDTTGLRLVFIPEGGLPEEVPYGVGGGMITFTAAAPGIFALVPIQN